MANNTRPTANKRAREKARMDRQKEKEQRRAEARDRRATAPPRSKDEDPDIAGIRPGPQPPPDWLEPEPAETEEKNS
jgi:hypothetical protein